MEKIYNKERNLIICPLSLVIKATETGNKVVGHVARVGWSHVRVEIFVGNPQEAKATRLVS